MFTYLFGKLKGWLAAAGVILLAVGVAFLKGRKAGKSSVEATIHKETQKVEQKFHKIDAAPADFDGAISSLRKRAGPKDKRG